MAVDADFGSVRVESWSNDEVDVEIEKRRSGISEDSAREAFDDVAVDISQRDNDVDIRIDRKSRFGSDRVSVDIRVRVPESHSLDLKTSGGDIKISNATGGGVTAQTSGGDIEARLLASVSALDEDWFLQSSGGELTNPRICRPRSKRRSILSGPGPDATRIIKSTRISTWTNGTTAGGTGGRSEPPATSTAAVISSGSKPKAAIFRFGRLLPEPLPDAAFRITRRPGTPRAVRA